MLTTLISYQNQRSSIVPLAFSANPRPLVESCLLLVVLGCFVDELGKSDWEFLWVVVSVANQEYFKNQWDETKPNGTNVKRTTNSFQSNSSWNATLLWIEFIKSSAVPLVMMVKLQLFIDATLVDWKFWIRLELRIINCRWDRLRDWATNHPNCSKFSFLRLRLSPYLIAS